MGDLKSKKRVISISVLLALVSVFLILVVISCSDSAKAKAKLIVKEPPRPGIVANIGGKEITEDTLIGEDKLDFLELKKREYELKMDRLNKLMVEILIGAEAKKANMSLEDYINKKVTGGEQKISESDYKKFVAEKRIPEAQITPQIKERIMAYLQATKKQDKINAYVAKLTQKSPVEVYFSKPKMVVSVDPGAAPAFGKAGAPVTIIEFSDFQCPFCSKAAETVTQIKKKYGNKVRLAFKHYPLPMHPDARPAAEASMCINEQGTEKFWKFHDLMFKNQDKLDKTSLDKYAKDTGADMAKFNECVNGKKYSGYIQQDLAYGEKLGVRSTPTFFINGQLVSGALPIDSFSEIIDEELDSKK